LPHHRRTRTRENAAHQKTVADVCDLSFQRIHFTPDLMPSDITGIGKLEDKADGGRQFVFNRGPVFANMILADEINRTPPKTQAALLDAMQEHQVTANSKMLHLPRALLRPCHAESHRPGGHLSTARGPARSLHAQHHHRIPQRGR
jgi:hypothetical protein